METFSADPQARSEIIQKANSLRAKDGQKLGSSIFAQTSTSADTPKDAASQEPGEDRQTQANTADTASSLPNCVVSFFVHLSVPLDEFFTEDILGQKSLLREMEAVSKRWLSFRSELGSYECGAQYKWKNSQLSNMIAAVSTDCRKFGDLLRRVAAIKIAPSQLLSPSMSATIAEKMQLL
eukprot:scpid92790/ scgid3804/ 